MLTISVVAFSIGAVSGPFDAKEILLAIKRIPASRSRRSDLTVSDKPTQPNSPAGADAPPQPAHREAQSGGGLSEGSVEEYAGSPDDEANQGGGYGDVYDSHGHLLWRFAAVERGNSRWTILRYSWAQASVRGREK